VDINAVITDVFSLLEHQFGVARSRFAASLSQDSVVVPGSEHQLQQVFLNLFLNARDAMPRGGWLSVVNPPSTATRSSRKCPTRARAFRPSISPAYTIRSFTTKAIGRGTGLGLSITYGIVREHQGAIRCDSAIGQGHPVHAERRGAVPLEQARAAGSASK